MTAWSPGNIWTPREAPTRQWTMTAWNDVWLQTIVTEFKKFCMWNDMNWTEDMEESSSSAESIGSDVVILIRSII
jgi:hypothetical protein